MIRLRIILVNICRMVIAITFILSGFVKAIDPLGTQYKIGDYLEAWGMGSYAWPMLTLALSVASSAVEFLLGISMLLLFVTVMDVCGGWLESLFGLRLELGMTTVVIAHVTFCLSYVAMVVLGRLKEFDNSLLEAAQDLGASGLYTFFHVTLPVIMPGIVAGALFAFTLSIDDFVITFFVKGAGDTTLPIYIQSAMRRGTPPVLNALSVIFLLLTFGLVFVTQNLLSKGKSE